MLLRALSNCLWNTDRHRPPKACASVSGHQIKTYSSPLRWCAWCPISPISALQAQRLSSYLCFQSKTHPPQGIPQCPIHMARVSTKLVSTQRRYIGDIDSHVPWCTYQHIPGHTGEKMVGGPPQSWVRGAAPPTPARGWMRDGGTPDVKRRASTFPSPHRAGWKVVQWRRRQRHSGTWEPLQSPKTPQQPPPAAAGPLCQCGWTRVQGGDISHSSHALCTRHLHPCSEQNTSTSPRCIFTRFCHNTNKKEDTPGLHVYMSHLLLFYW